MELIYSLKALKCRKTYKNDLYLGYLFEYYKILGIYYPRFINLIEILLSGYLENNIFQKYLIKILILLQLVMVIKVMSQCGQQLKYLDINFFIKIYKIITNLIIISEFIYFGTIWIQFIIYFLISSFFKIIAVILVKSEINESLPYLFCWSLFETPTFNFKHYEVSKICQSMNITKIISIYLAVSLIIQSLIFLYLSFIFEKNFVCILISLFNLPLTVISISLAYQFKGVLKVNKTFKSQQEILPFLKNYPNQQALIIQKKNSKDLTKQQNIFSELEEQDDSSLTEKEQYDLLQYLYSKKDKELISIQQYNILIQGEQFIVHSIIQRSVLMQLLCEVEEIPVVFLPPQSYMNFDIQKIQLERCLFLKFNDIPKLNISVERDQIYLAAFQQSIQIRAFIQNLTVYININPAQVLYDLYSV
ncbi:transmembrane protein, putative (macronuclear) [Tetrahymena thermophila SB210]|uniref:Transmembrane protein, putative n=1 Tax=Tetrahymena thermophila (strain SB210) TaxID=312017 RepID=I7MEX1_TETTS|nr:transmembrane protein, putative [Tetrahymena thermophila SB210]EAR97961.2 transmembrane protein, putative [Tetrahymena thermophila SB210]|eukprot:XP_001018206.2 transmembrane protein, putative [Tetrahymena thermophila SB210]